MFGLLPVIGTLAFAAGALFVGIWLVGRRPPPVGMVEGMAGR
jgi:hypothetical protein